MVRWVGFRATTVDIIHAKRQKGESNYTFRGHLRLALRVMLSFSEKPLYLATMLGFSITAISMLVGTFYLIKTLAMDDPLLGWASVFISLWFLGGLIVFIVGIAGLYIGKVYDQVKQRPIYIVDDTVRIES
jgi:dolichol-phosphate mannosyltransferase